jgi:hypothetical protein
VVRGDRLAEVQLCCVGVLDRFGAVSDRDLGVGGPHVVQGLLQVPVVLMVNGCEESPAEARPRDGQIMLVVVMDGGLDLRGRSHEVLVGDRRVVRPQSRLRTLEIRQRLLQMLDVVGRRRLRADHGRHWNPDDSGQYHGTERSMRDHESPPQT